MTRVHGLARAGNAWALSLNCRYYAREDATPATIESRTAPTARERQTHDFRCSRLKVPRDLYVGRKLRPKTSVEYHCVSPWARHSRVAVAADLRRSGKDDVRDVLRMIEQRGSPAAANRTLAYLSKFFSWCVEEDLVAASPTARVRTSVCKHALATVS